MHKQLKTSFFVVLQSWAIYWANRCVGFIDVWGGWWFPFRLFRTNFKKCNATANGLLISCKNLFTWI